MPVRVISLSVLAGDERGVARGVSARSRTFREFPRQSLRAQAVWIMAKVGYFESSRSSMILLYAAQRAGLLEA